MRRSGWASSSRKSRAFLFIESASHATSETRYAPADAAGDRRSASCDRA